MDPYHDYKHQVSGYPDADTSATIVSCFNYATDVKAPSGSVGLWDAHIFSLPNAAGNTHCVANLQNTGQFIAGASLAYLDFLNIMTADSGQSLFPDTDPWAPTHFDPQSLPVPTDGQSRIIGFGFEIINTTAEMYKQGTITAYKMPQVGSDTNVILQRTGVSIGQISPARHYRSPPSHVTDALLLSGTVQWPASDGAYVVGSQSSIENPLTPAVIGGSLYAPDGALSPGDIVAIDNLSAIVANAPPALSLYPPARSKYIPFNTSGVFLTGLSQQTTLRVTLKVFVERAPTQKEPDLAVLATPSAPYDDRALKLYSALWTKLPVAVPVGENGFGDWWKRIMKVVSAVAIPIGLATGNPAAGTAVAGVTGGLSTVFEKGNGKGKEQASRMKVANNAVIKQKQPEGKNFGAPTVGRKRRQRKAAKTRSEVAA